MPSEKLRYLRRRIGPESPLDLNELREQLRHLDPERLVEILWVRAQTDDLLRKVLIASVALHAGFDPKQLRAAVDCALHFPDFVRYSESGHGQILDEIKKAVQELVAGAQHEKAIDAAEYVVNRAEQIAENFEEDWEWRCSLQKLAEYLNELKHGRGADEEHMTIAPAKPKPND